MASNVNVKFVAILTGVLVALSVVVGVAYVSTKLKSADELESLGDKAMESGEYADARLYYSKAVNKEQNNIRRLRKWLAAVEQWQPETETEYESGFVRTYMVVQRGVAAAEPLNPDTQAAFLEMVRQRSLVGGYAREASNQFIRAVSDAIEPFENNPSAPEDWEKIRRYRGMEIERIISEGGVVEPQERQLAIDDLNAAIEADPTDGEAAITLARLLASDAERLYQADRPEEADAAYASALARLDGFMEGAPNEPWSTIYRPLLDFERERLRRTHRLLPDEAREVSRELLPTYRAQFERALEVVAGHADKLNEGLLQPAISLEGAVDPQGGFPRTRAILRDAIEAQPNNSSLVIFAARLAEQAGDHDAAISWYEQAVSLPNVPMSLEGWLRYPVRRQALIAQADLLIRRSMEDPELTEQERQRMLTRADELRNDYASRVPGDDPRLLFVDGLRKIAAGEMDDALRLFQQYNQLTADADPRGLWRAGQAAARLGQEGVAEKAFESLVSMNPTNYAALFSLADVKLRLQKNEAALAMLERARELAPDNQEIRDRLAVVRALVNPDQAEDPVVGLILRSRQVRLGDAEKAADPAAAQQILEKGLADHNQHPLIARELVVVLLDQDKLPEARTVAQTAARANPDDEGLERLVEGLEGDTVLDVRLWLIEQGNLQPLERALARYTVFEDEGEPERAAEALAQAEAADPNNPRVLEARFTRLLSAGEFAQADRLATRAAELDADGMGGLSFRARALAAQERYEEAIDVMRQAIDQGAAPVAAYRLLALQQRAAGRPQDAVNTLERALEASPDDVRTINDYLGALVAVGRVDDALDAARRSERFGRGNPDFIDSWLNLETMAGGDAGRQLAMQRRLRMLQTNPADRANKARLASLYINERRWAEAKKLIDELQAEEDALGVVTLLATWYADQGRLEIDGTVRSGMDLARSAFTDYIVKIPESEMTSTPWMAMAGFLTERGDIASALQALEEARAYQTDDHEVDRMLGDLMLERGRFAEARDAYQRIVDAGADDPRQSYLQRLIEAHLRLGGYAEAEAALDRLNEPTKSSLTALLQRAEAAGGAGDQARAADLLTRAVNENPDRPLAYTLRARNVLARGGLVQDALADLDNALRIDPSFTRARRMRAGVYFREGREEDALRDLREVVRQDPSLTDVAFSLVEEQLERGRERDALNVVDEVIQKRPQDFRAMLGFAELFASHELWTRSSSLYETAWTRSKTPAVGARLIGSLLRQERPRLEQARAVLGEIAAVVPEARSNPGFLAIDASIEEAAGNHARAVELLRESFVLSPADPRSVFAWSANFVDVYRERTAGEQVRVLREIRSGLKDAAQLRWIDLLIGRGLVAEEATRADGIAMLASLREARRDDAVALISFQTEGAAHYAAEDYASARRVWSEGLAQFPDDAEMSNNMAFMMVDKTGEAEGALDYALKAVERGGGRAAMHDTLAAVYIALERFDEARQALDAADRVAQTAKDRLDVLISRAKLAIAEGETSQARAMLNDALELTVPMGAERAGYETKIEELLAEIGSADD